jgi:DNA-binding LytR/AlgR family response regulator
MSDKTSILIVEDDMIIAANISLQLSKLGYEVTGIESRGKDALNHARENKPDIILMDIHLKGKIDGIETAKLIQRELDIPLIYLTANADDASFQRAKETHPFAFISKPFNKLNLERTIALVVEKIKEKTPEDAVNRAVVEQTLSDRIFIRNQNKLVKIMLEDILYIEADRNYCSIVTPTQTFMIVSPLNSFCEKIGNKNFVRIHRSFVVNITKLDAVAESHVEMNRKVIPISKLYKEELVKLLNRV